MTLVYFNKILTTEVISALQKLATTSIIGLSLVVALKDTGVKIDTGFYNFCVIVLSIASFLTAIIYLWDLFKNGWKGKAARRIFFSLSLIVPIQVIVWKISESGQRESNFEAAFYKWSRTYIFVYCGIFGFTAVVVVVKLLVNLRSKEDSDQEPAPQEAQIELPTVPPNVAPSDLKPSINETPQGSPARSKSWKRAFKGNT